MAETPKDSLMTDLQAVTTAERLGRYKAELLASGIDPDTTVALIIEAQRSMLNVGAEIVLAND